MAVRPSVNLFRDGVFSVSRRVRLPDKVRIEPVGKCNLNCRMCPGGIRRNGRQAFMPVEVFDDLLDQFKSAREIQLEGLGEPLLHPSFTQFIDLAAGRGLKVTTTNLTLLNEKIANSFVSGNLDALSVFVESPSEDTCGWLCREAFVSSSGKMIPRPNVGTPDRCHMGDSASDGVASVWNGPRFNEFRSKLVDGDPPEICKNCSRTRAPGA